MSDIEVDQTPAFIPFKLWMSDYLGLPQYIPHFIANDLADITLALSIETDEDLKEIGIKNKFHRRKILAKLQELKENRKEFKRWFLAIHNDFSRYIGKLEFHGILTFSHFSNFLEDFQNEKVAPPKLHEIGITNPTHCAIILASIKEYVFPSSKPIVKEGVVEDGNNNLVNVALPMNTNGSGISQPRVTEDDMVEFEEEKDEGI